MTEKYSSPAYCPMQVLLFVFIIHPTGNLSPSQEDKDITKVLLEASKIMDIHMLDHIIVAAEIGEMYSFKEDGLLDQLRVRSQSWER